MTKNSFEPVGGLTITFQGQSIPFSFEPIVIIDNTSFELLSHHHQLLQLHFFDSRKRPVKVEVVDITGTQRKNLTRAFALIKTYVPDFFQLLEYSIQKVMIFNDPQVKRNSFATLSVHGCAFFNSFQKGYDEVFFIEDIAHQCGHVIFNNMIHGNKEIFKCSPETVIREKGLFGLIVNLLENRTLFSAFHALFTYSTISICLEACILKSELTNTQKHEALGRLAFCLLKYGNDVALLKRKDKTGNSLYFTEKGLELYRPIELQFKRLHKEWGLKLNQINLGNQPYNFSFEDFQKSNPLYEKFY